MSFNIPTGVDRSPGALPVAKPAWPWGRVTTAPDEKRAEEPGITPGAIQGWAWSLGLHGSFLLLFALWVFTPPRDQGKSFDTSLGAQGGGGSGGEAGELAGLEGLDQPLVLAEPMTMPVDSGLTRLPTDEITLDPDVAPKAASARDGGSAAEGGPGRGAGGGAGDGFGPALFGDGIERIGGVGVKVGDPQFTLIWDSKADIDLHVLEPGGSEIFWESPQGAKGGELDVDDVDGLGPENVYWVQGQGPPGTYRWFVHYYGGLGGLNVPTQWKVRIKYKGQVKVYKGVLRGVGAKSRVYTLDVERDAPDAIAEEAKAPGE